jgi:hypothetical protein
MMNARGKFITNKRVDIITQNAAAQMMCCLRTRILFSESLSFLNTALGCIFYLSVYPLPGIQILGLNTLLTKGEDSTICQL